MFHGVIKDLGWGKCLLELSSVLLFTGTARYLSLDAIEYIEEEKMDDELHAVHCETSTLVALQNNHKSLGGPFKPVKALCYIGKVGPRVVRSA
jgi:hypothetical protein